jgi:hypothetical protein
MAYFLTGRESSKEDLTMTASNLLRWAGLAALAGGVLIVLAALLGAAIGPEETSGTFVFQQVLSLLGAVLILLGLVGLYASQAEAAGPLGLLGFLVAFLGTTLVAGVFWATTFIAPILAAEAPEVLEETSPVGFPLTFLTTSIGWLLFGLATLRAGVYPRVAAIVLMVGAVVSFLPLPGSEAVLAVGIAWLGFLLFAGRATAAQPPPRVS